ncbi:hypothetical protein SAMN02983003_0613 [Devosia enhydra]|uniref:Uncharacterized protein n=1 Tax=Devosia enhydra TaxID=665118 RepID=A0A1K2HTP7_9HYPH|nr:hypothetical protein [Devosia enhydra]SFZ81647.1 hypothetical protein SAMN02983003_0613 [Devosia enhydra]
MTFETDGCTGWLNSWRGIDLYQCCVQHDRTWYDHPGDWTIWAISNLDLGRCFAMVGAWELAVPAVLATCTVGALLFLRHALLMR